MVKRATIAYIPSSHLDLYWLGNYKTCLERGAELIGRYLDRCLETPDETFFLETVVFANYLLQKYPAYREPLIRLVREGRVEVGAAYVDRWETLAPAESLIRNVIIGKRWCRDVLGVDNPTITHPDLPSLTPQIPQIYSQLGLRYYVTSRKVFRHGQVWRYRAPDGSRILVLNWPRHYVFAPMDASDVTPEVLKTIWVPPLDLVETLKGFPLGAVAVAGSAGDLAGLETFRERYGQGLADFVAAYRQKYPDYDFTYTIPSRVLSAYDHFANLPERSGGVPSVWGVAADEDIAFFDRDRRLEARLLTAESLSAVLGQMSLPWRPTTADGWQGVFYEGAFFARKDPIPQGKEFDELWRMHVFTQDHNGGGQEGVLSSFQKRTIQERGLAYTQELIDFGLEQIAANLDGEGQRLVVFNPHAQPWSGPMAISLPGEVWTGSSQLADEDGHVLVSQAAAQQDGNVEVHVSLADLPPLGYRALFLRQGAVSSASRPLQVTRGAAALSLASPHLEVSVDLWTGSLERVYDLRRQQEWGAGHLGRLYSVEESGNDVSLRIRPDAAVAQETLLSVDLLEEGPLFTRVRIHKQLLKCEVEQTLTLWAHAPRLDLETRLFWWGKHHQQVRMGLSAPVERDIITCGSAFYGAGWMETVEGCGPWNADEISADYQMSYREVLGWVHLAGSRGGMTIVSNQPGYHHGPQGLEAVLLRTATSCGDGRLHFEHPGEHVFTFSFVAGEADWKAANAQQLSARLLKPPVYRLARAVGAGKLPAAMSFLKVKDERFALSCAYAGSASRTVVVRVWETTGRSGTAHFSGPMAGGQPLAVNFLEEGGQPLKGRPGEWELEMPAWGIRTVLFKGEVLNSTSISHGKNETQHS